MSSQILNSFSGVLVDPGQGTKIPHASGMGWGRGLVINSNNNNNNKTTRLLTSIGRQHMNLDRKKDGDDDNY